MSSHPNVILKLTIKPDGTTRKLLCELLAKNREEIPDEKLPLWKNTKGEYIENRDGEKARIVRDDGELCIGEFIYHALVMESDYDDSWQISGEEGDLVIFDLVTYGYGREISWQELEKRKNDLEAWVEKNGLTFSISVSANHW